ncbi:MAG: LacI family DNA-binding transcriptional regulator [Clostridia bacterium]|nr:LacI family transcriptional regulator [Oscillospiraceae bacterium]MBQ7033156.1 LacI family DNA-binding transcriptional regulator [Clostridia bacterium]
MKKLTVKDIAKIAGVSVTAVSFVLNNKPGVSDATRKRVQKIIDETDFKPSLSSKKLVLKQSFNICLMMNAFSSPFEDLFYFEITRGIINQSMKCNYNVIISKPIMSQSELPDLIYSGDADGIIFMQDISPALIEKAQATGVPFLVVDSHANNENVTSINPDYKKATYDATSYLLQHGHTEICMIASNVVPDFYTQTLSGFTDAMAAHGICPHPAFYNIAATNEASAYAEARKLLDRPNRPSAVLCTVDSFAIGVMRCAKDLHLKIPQDVSIIGIDDILLSRYIEPKLTTIGIDKVGMGTLAMDMIIQKIQGKTVESILLPMELIERDSVKTIQ